MQQKLLDTAKKYKQNGLSIIATDNYKRPVEAWKKYQNDYPTESELNNMFSKDNAKGIAIIAGAVSGGLEIIDVDCKYDLTGKLFVDFIESIKFCDRALKKKLVIAETKNGGYHLFYRCEEIQGNQKLANRPTTEEERKENPHNKVVVLIETRGEAGYVCAAPSEGYNWVQGNDETIPTITTDERDVLLSCARGFNTFIEEVRITEHEFPKPNGFSKSPFDDYNQRGDVVTLLENHGWRVVNENGEKVVFKRPGNTQSKTSGDFNKRLNLFSVFTTSTEFTPNKGYFPSMVYTLLECNGDYKKAHRQLLEEGFGEKLPMIDLPTKKNISKMRQLGKSDDSIIIEISQSDNIPLDEAKKKLADFEKFSGESLKTFWDVDINKFTVSIKLNKLMDLYSQKGGFWLYFYDKESNIYKVIRDDNGIIEEASPEMIKKYIKNYILDLPSSFDCITRDQLMETVLRSSSTLFSDNFFEFLDKYTPDFLKDTKECSYFPFRNKVACITKDGVELKTYREIDKCIWRSQVIDFDIQAEEVNPDQTEFFQFIRKICDDNPEKLKYFITIIGYLLHGYKDPLNPFAVILAEETDDESKGGGTGKGLFVNAINQMVNIEQIDGKNFSTKKSFAFQRVNIDTSIIAIQDVRKGLDFESFYSIITEGIPIEKKNKDELYLPYADSPKIMFTTNYTVRADSNHAKRRQKVLEFGSFFSPSNTPLDFFGHRMFDDWDNSQWSLFYNFMFSCIQTYMTHGIQEMKESESGKHKRIKMQFGEDFEKWLDGYIKDETEIVDAKGQTQWKLGSKLYEDFLSESEQDKKDYSRERFKKALKTGLAILDYQLDESKIRLESPNPKWHYAFKRA